jgi:hypothetical protein
MKKHERAKRNIRNEKIDYARLYQILNDNYRRKDRREAREAREAARRYNVPVLHLPPMGSTISSVNPGIAYLYIYIYAYRMCLLILFVFIFF